MSFTSRVSSSVKHQSIIDDLNAIALLLHSSFSFAGLYNNCYCNSSYIRLGDRGYMVFLTGEEIRNVWGACFVTGVGFTFYLVVAGSSYANFKNKCLRISERKFRKFCD
jgi:hypothetical protein